MSSTCKQAPRVLVTILPDGNKVADFPCVSLRLPLKNSFLRTYVYVCGCVCMCACVWRRSHPHVHLTLGDLWMFLPTRSSISACCIIWLALVPSCVPVQVAQRIRLICTMCESIKYLFTHPYPTICSLIFVRGRVVSNVVLHVNMQNWCLCVCVCAHFKFPRLLLSQPMPTPILLDLVKRCWRREKADVLMPRETKQEPALLAKSAYIVCACVFNFWKKLISLYGKQGQRIGTDS